MSSPPAALVKEGSGIPVKHHRFQHKAAVVIFSAVQGRGQLRGGEATGWQAELDSVTLLSRTWPFWGQESSEAASH